MTVECVVDCRNKLGEVPVWDVAEQALYWVDIEGRLLQRLEPATGRLDRWEMPERIACFALREKGGLIVGFASGIAFYDLDTGAIDWIARPEADRNTRFNEGKCDRQGRFWTGTMDDSLAEHDGALYRVDPDLTVTRVLGNVGISNTMVWSLDDRSFYFADTLDGRIDRFDFDAVSGNLSNRRPVIDLSGTGIGPDGSTIDTDGYIWNAQWDGWRLARYSPDGELDRIVELPVQKPTSCMFGGADLRTLYVTTAIWDLTPEQLRAQPQAGGLFAVDVGIGGVPESRFAG
ncbi:MAG: SMP-30/gluconolactonase/LRE family protein [Bauldia sp.]|uniref:SMP-30/gluconolactonase/LRE family protein n=1 Tax=Bauldia sp. TaxID=2575872 RepID=UPI001D90FC01|nr:SMP-30/gluconolactonase/LRE family protein [Bauldia sp.]MCB1495102.1 SMP-30/gluconolactonase/LRE family protein [Bauldia sp.]